MRRNDNNSLLSGCAPSHGVAFVRYMAVLVAFFVIFPLSLFAQQRTAVSYEVLSATSSELIVRIAPSYLFDTVTTESGKAIRIKFSGALFVNAIGAPAEMQLSLPVLLPSAQTPTIEVLSEKYETVSGLELAPVPTHIKRDDIFVERYVRDASLYASSISHPNYQFVQTGTTRTAYSGSLDVFAVRREAGRICLAKEITLRLNFAPNAQGGSVPASSREAEFFRTTFINGNVTAFYRSAASAISRTARSVGAGYKRSPAAGEEKWVAIKTTEEGVYHITAEQLSQYGITNADPSTIALYGYGAKMVPEGLDSTTGELAEVAIDVRTSGGVFRELRFYAPGIHDWRYSPEPTPSWINDKYWQLYHMTNPYSPSGHFMLKVGGAAGQKRIVDKADEVTNPVVSRDKVPAVALYENELNFEYPSISREFVGETITRGIDLNITLPPLPGYTPDSTYIRPATNSRAEQSHTFEFKINGTQLGTVSGRVIAELSKSPFYSLRNWDAIFPLQSGVGTPTTLTIGVSSSEKQPQYWLDFIEIYYQRQAKLSSGVLTFFLANDTSSYRLSIDEASNAELWDISEPAQNLRLATSSGNSIVADLQGPGAAMRRFIAFRESDLKAPELSSTTAPSLRPDFCQNGADLIVIVPEAYKAEGERLAEQRRRGGQATEPLSVEVVTVEDIYKEFGYGAKDLTSIRDFLAYTFRHTVANGKTVPLFVSLFAKGHTDYQNRKTQLPLYIPDYETSNFGSLQVYRREHPEYVPDDAFFVRLLPRQDDRILDMALGRITVRDADEAKVFVDKVIRYETSSDEGNWRARTVFIADDRYWEEGTKGSDPLQHMEDTKNEIAGVDTRLTIEKVYGVSYPNTFTSSGARLKPEMEAAIVDAFNSGSVLISFVGHGNPNVWTHESILKVPSTINKFTNLNRLAFLTTATCDFTAFDNYDELSGGVMLLIKSDGGIIGSLATNRSVYAGEDLVSEFYRKLFAVGCAGDRATAPVGLAYVAGRKVGDPSNKGKFFILGDPSQRLLIPREHVLIDSINGASYDEAAEEPFTLKALSQVTLAGYIASSCDGDGFDPSFNGSTTITLRDAPTHITQTTEFTDSQHSTITDRWDIEGPILYRGTATVVNGRFSVTFIVPKDIKYDTLDAKLQMLAYSDDFRSALGAASNLQVFGIDTSHIVDTEGPKLTIFIGNRRFTSGDIVPVHSKIIVDIEDASGLNTSTSSIGHSFAGWVNDLTSDVIDLSESYVSRQDDYKGGTAERQAVLPLGKNVLHVRAFDALNNPSEANVEFIARDADPYELFDVALSSNPVRSGTTFSFLQPSSPQNPVDVSLDIYTSDGRKVRSLGANGITVNEVRIPWNVHDDGGVLVTDGAYIYRIIIEDRLTGEVAHASGVFIVQKQ